MGISGWKSSDSLHCALRIALKMAKISGVAELGGGVDESGRLGELSVEAGNLGTMSPGLAAKIIWRSRKLLFVAYICAVLLGVAYCLLATEWYQADVALIPANSKSSSGGFSQFSGLASLAGVDVSAGVSVESLAVLRSKDFARNYIYDQKLMPILFESKWDSAVGKWKSSDPSRQLDIRDAVNYFATRVLSVSEDKKSGIVTVSVRWKDPQVAAAWANAIVKELNDRMRGSAIREAQTSIAYLQVEMQSATLVAVQQSVGRVLEAQLQKMVLAKTNEDFAFKVIDKAVPPKRPASPNKMSAVFLANILGLVLGVLAIFAGRAVVREMAGTRIAALVSRIL